MESRALSGDSRQVGIECAQIECNRRNGVVINLGEGNVMRKILFVVLFSGSFLLAQEGYPADSSQQKPKASKGEITVQGCVGRSSGDYVLTKQNPAMTYELQSTGKTRLKNYMGQRVEVTGKESATLSTSSDAMNKTGSASSVTLTISSIRTIEKECTVRQAADK
jgi:hypothetical protein